MARICGELLSSIFWRDTAHERINTFSKTALINAGNGVENASPNSNWHNTHFWKYLIFSAVSSGNRGTWFSTASFSLTNKQYTTLIVLAIKWVYSDLCNFKFKVRSIGNLLKKLRQKFIHLFHIKAKLALESELKTDQKS